MVTLERSVYITPDIHVNYYKGLSTDTKPTPETDEVLNGSEFFEMDTEDKYWYDQDGSQWTHKTVTP